MPIPTLVPLTKESVTVELDPASSRFDSVVAIISAVESLANLSFYQVIASATKIDRTIGRDVVLIHTDGSCPGGRIILSPTGPINRDYDDVRRFIEASRAGIRRAKDAGSIKPLLLFPDIPASQTHPEYARAVEASLLGVLAELYQPLVAREKEEEWKHRQCGPPPFGVLEPVEVIGFYSPTVVDGDRIATIVTAIEMGRRVARDIGGPDPERMTPYHVADYLRQAFRDLPCVKLTVEADPEDIRGDYPLLHAVSRCSISVPRHRPCVVRLEYNGDGASEDKRVILLAGKGVTYDTGGADLKVGGVMAGMSRDKCGASAVAGFVRAVAALRPRNLRVIGLLGMVRNSVGADSYVADEIITAHSGVRVFIGNTDAEGRLVLADLLSHLRIEAVAAAKTSNNIQICSIATLTGHAGRAVGPYSIAIDNGPARRAGTARSLAEVGEQWGDMFELSTLRREDYDFVKSRNATFDVLQANTQPSSVTARGHQYPAAFLNIASGLARHGNDSEIPLCYTHLDIAASAVEGGDYQFGKPTAVPIVGLVARFVLDKIN